MRFVPAVATALSLQVNTPEIWATKFAFSRPFSYASQAALYGSRTLLGSHSPGVFGVLTEAWPAIERGVNVDACSGSTPGYSKRFDNAFHSHWHFRR
jgi:hypothetical protein